MILWKYYSCKQIEKNEMGGLCSTYGKRYDYRILL